MAKLSENHYYFKDYKIILAAGNGEKNIEEEVGEIEDNLKLKNSLDKVRNAIENNDKTITISVGQLTTGVTIPEWTGVMMLSNIKSPALYFQAAFRSQNPYEFTDPKDGKLYVKENAYIFDFAPERTLLQFDEFANNLSFNFPSTREERKANIRELINFLPVIAEDKDGYMHELNSEEVLTIPHTIKAIEVVKRGFMSNLLFENIHGIFQAPEVLRVILEKMPIAKNQKISENKEININEPTIDDDGNIEVEEAIILNHTDKLGVKKYIESSENLFTTDIENYTKKEENSDKRAVKAFVNDLDFSSLKTDYNLSNKSINNFKEFATDNIINNINKELKSVKFDLSIKDREIEENKKKLEMVETIHEKEAIEEKIQKDEEVKKSLIEGFNKKKEEILIESIKESVSELEVKKQEMLKNETEDQTRDHLRGFARTIPSFLMAYGDRNTKLSNFDKIVDEKEFEEITSITMDEFKILRDGTAYIDKDGVEKFAKGLFNETVFDSSIQEFFDVKDRLANYYSENQKEDIFDYIPPQKTNQIFTPRKVVVKMLDLLEKENPDIFKNKDTKFADLYSKSGIYLVEIIKRLNKGISSQILNEQERIKWIIENQIYTLAPTKTIYNIVKNYIMSDFKNIDSSHIAQLDLVPFAKEGRVKEEIQKLWGENMKFDVIIGNPPYQKQSEGDNKNYSLPIYHLFYENSFELAKIVSYITPARFLFNAGDTPKAWNKKMLTDNHIKVNYFEQNSSNLFPNTDIKGGVAILIRNKDINYGPIEVFTPYEELRTLMKKVKKDKFISINTILYGRNSYKFTETLVKENPNIKEILKTNTKTVGTNIFEKLSNIFSNEKLNDNYIAIYGRQNNERVYRWIDRKYIEDHPNLEKWKVFLPKSNGSGAIGEKLSTPLIGHTETFISFGAFDTELEAKNLLKYIKTRFARTLLGVKKITQDNATAEVWSYVPLQDFTANSDIDWTKSIAEIDQQLYKKYKLSQEEINFIEEKIQKMD